MGWIKNYVLVVNPYWNHIVGQIEKQIQKSLEIIEEVAENDLPWSPTSGSNEPTPDPNLPIPGDSESEVSGSE